MCTTGNSPRYAKELEEEEEEERKVVGEGGRRRRIKEVVLIMWYVCGDIAVEWSGDLSGPKGVAQFDPLTPIQCGASL
jgi:hypothetical protein